MGHCGRARRTAVANLRVCSRRIFLEFSYYGKVFMDICFFVSIDFIASMFLNVLLFCFIGSPAIKNIFLRIVSPKGLLGQGLGPAWPAPARENKIPKGCSGRAWARPSPGQAGETKKSMFENCFSQIGPGKNKNTHLLLMVSPQWVRPSKTTHFC